MKAKQALAFLSLFVLQVSAPVVGFGQPQHLSDYIRPFVGTQGEEIGRAHV